MTDPRAEIQIKDLRPVEAYLLMNPRKYAQDECIRLILIDLILQGVLDYWGEKSKKKSWLTPPMYYFIQKGEHFNTAKTSSYERLFRLPLVREKSSEPMRVFDFGQEFVKENLGARRNIAGEVQDYALNFKLFYPHWSYWLTHWFTLSTLGQQLSAELVEMLEQKKSVIARYKSNNSQQVFAEFDELGSLFILLFSGDSTLENPWPHFFQLSQYIQHRYGLKESRAKSVATLMVAYHLKDCFYLPYNGYDDFD